MATRTKTEPAAESEVKEPTETPEPVAEDKETLKSVVKEILDELTAGKETVEEPEGKPMTARQEEANAHSIVSQLVEEFRSAMKGDDTEKKEEKKEPEVEPGKKGGRWIEGFLWGKE
jgi:hypothetical protein